MTERRSAAACWSLNVRITWLVLLLTLFRQLSSTGARSPPILQSRNGAPTHSRRQPRLNQDFTLVGAGDIAGANHLMALEATAKLIEKIPGTVFVAGDLAYEGGTADEFETAMARLGAEFKNRTQPALEITNTVSPTASAYFQYWGDQAGPVGKGYYSYDLGGWHIVALNTNCVLADFGGCGVGRRKRSGCATILPSIPTHASGLRPSRTLQ